MKGISLSKKHFAKSLNANRYFLGSFFVYKPRKKLLLTIRVSLLRECNAPYSGQRPYGKTFFRRLTRGIYSIKGCKHSFKTVRISRVF